MTDGLTKINKVSKVNRVLVTDLPGTEEEKDNLISKRESSLDYD